MENITVGMHVWSQNSYGEKVKSAVIEVGRTPVPSTHRVVHLVLSDGKEVWVSPDHPTATGQRVAEIKAGDWHASARVKSAESVAYAGSYTYDLLPDSETGVYWANGILLGSSLK